MFVTFDPVLFPMQHRVKARSTTLGATRSRLLWVLRNLGFVRDRIEAQVRDERESHRLIEEQRLDRLREEEEAHRRFEEWADTIWFRDEQLARLREEQRASWLIREKCRYELMTDEGKAAARQEDEIVAWLTIDEIEE
jgi:hypothetical protein